MLVFQFSRKKSVFIDWIIFSFSMPAASPVYRNRSDKAKYDSSGVVHCFLQLIFYKYANPPGLKKKEPSHIRNSPFKPQRTKRLCWFYFFFLVLFAGFSGTCNRVGFGYTGYHAVKHVAEDSSFEFGIKLKHGH